MNDIARGKRILVVEDEYYIADDLRRAIDRAGASIMGPVGNVAAALAAIDRERPDAVILDVNLNGDPSYAVAERLEREAIPFIFFTGYDGWSLPGQHRDTPRLTKPCNYDQVLDIVARLIGGTR